MLSVVPIKQSSIASSYYLKQDGGYYIEDGNNKDLYQWVGRGANDLGLVDTVSNQDYHNVYSGRLPNGDIIGKQMPDGTIKGRPGYDLTFSMNKDLSLIICASNDKNLSDYFLNAHINAVKTVMTEVEKRIEARITLDGFTTFEITKNMIAALCTHFSSRAGDPDVHTHALITNATKRSDGKWRALATDMSRKNGFFEMIRDNATFFGALYQNEMALAAQSKGFAIESIYKNGMFKIAGFPDDVRDFFSKRRKQIEEIVSTLNPAVQNNKVIVAKVAQNSKASKETMDQESFFEKSKHDMQQYFESNQPGKTLDSILQGCIERNHVKTPSSDIAQAAVKSAISNLSKFHISFDKNKIAHQVITQHLGEVTHQDVQAMIKQLIESKELVFLKNNEYTTATLIEREKNIIESINNGTCIVTEKTTTPAPENHFSNLFQKNRFCVITEPNSLQDKSKFLNELITQLESERKNVKVLTLDHAIKNDLNDQRKRSSNVFELLKNIAKGDRAESVHAFIKKYEESTRNPVNNLLSSKEKEVLIIDDAKRLDFDSIQKLIDLSEKRKANIVFLKNHNGRHSIFSGNPISLIEKCNIKKIDARSFYKDQKEPINNNDLSKKITITEAPGSDKPQTSFAKQSLRHKTISTLIASQSLDQIEHSMAVSHSKRSTEQLNIVIREELQRTGKISQQQYVIKMLKPMYLDDTQKTQAKHYPENALLKTYLGRGVFRTQKILGHDPAQNKVILQSEFGRRSLVDPNKITKDMLHNISTLYEEKSIALSKDDRIFVVHENRLSKQLKLKSNQSYKISEINEKHITLQGASSNEKIKTKLGSLNNLSLNYHYAISAHDSLSSLKNKKQVFCDLPAYAVNANVLSDIGRHTDEIHVVTDDASIAKDRVDKYFSKEYVIDYKVNQKYNTHIHEHSTENKKEQRFQNNEPEMTGL